MSAPRARWRTEATHRSTLERTKSTRVEARHRKLLCTQRARGARRDVERMALHLFDNAAPAWAASGQYASNYQVGQRFKSSQGGYITQVGFYRQATGTNYNCDNLSVWDTTTQSRVVNVATPADDGAAGWQWNTLGTPYNLVANRVYAVVMSVPSGKYNAQVANGSKGTPPYPLAWDTNSTANVAAGPGNYPNNVGNGTINGVDIGWDPTAQGGSGPATVPDLDTAVADLEAYIDAGNATILSMLSNEGTPSAYSIPNQIKTAINDASTGLGAIKGAVDSIATDVGDILTSVGAALATAVSTVQDTLSHASTGMVDVLNGVSSTVDDILNSASTGLVKVLNYLGGGGGALPPRSAVPATGWANVATTAFTDDIAWTQPADMYVVTFSDVGANDTTTLVSGLDIVYRLAWWLPLNATQLQGERRFIDAPLVELTDGGKRMPGLALHCPKGGAGTIDAWQYTP